ncbi:TonB-dependent receptor [Flavobacterium fluviale]|uniref:SusC/RagA family TonB-linked outer membrane protein n=1 Tax=Flavobacterium fluviale TaxID=2249356 RepID=A0A344LW11_9FLAO|nr:TonB-dependent receptor [Flavobacterium fluviale]AXB58103.1 SusC/RagA family TonB-linked outer membrane protein [Flavobacterium fluviale]
MKKIILKKFACPYFPKISLKMKLSTILLFVSLFKIQAHTYSQNTKITLHVKEAAIGQIFNKIETISEFRFLFESGKIDVNRKITLDVNKKNISEVLQILFNGTDVVYKINDRQILLTVKPKVSAVNKESKAVIVKPDQILEISGIVSDQNKVPLPGVNVVVKGTTNGTQTDMDGKFTIKGVEENSILVFSYLGFITQEAAVKNTTTINVTLLEDVAQLNEVVLVGYGSVKKKDVTGAVATIGNKELNRVGATSPMQALQTNAAGVNISQKSGSVGSDFNIQIRGANSLTGGTPLYVVDGVMTDNINFLNPNDIQRIDILKDASSTAIYGSRGSNGVVIVTTYSGEGMKSKKSSITYSGYVGVRAITNMPDFLNSYDESVAWTRDRQVARDLVQANPIIDSPTYGFPTVINEDGTNYWEEALENRRGTDWLGDFLKSSIQQNHFISANGSNETTSYVIGFGYQGDNGNAEGQSYEKYNFKASIDASPGDKFSIGANINLAYSDRELVSRQGYTQQLFRMPSYAPAKDAAGNTVQSPMIGISSNVNPYAFLESNSKYNVEQFNILSNFYLGYKPAKWISLKSTFSPSAVFSRTGEYLDRFASRSISVARMWNDNRLSYVWDNQLNINKEIGRHSISYDFIQSSQFDRLESTYVFGRDVPFQSLWYNVQSAPQRDATSGFSKSTLLSFTNRFNYSFNDKYLVTATIRWDGSSKLSPGNKWASFPSGAVAWKLKEESFLKDVSQIDNLKLRVSFGYTGNNNIAPYSSQSALNSQTYYDWDGTSANGFLPATLSNSKLTWERTREWNFGTDFGFFGNRITGEINYYDRLSEDLLMNRKLATPTGWANMIDNVGSVSNRGVEIQLKTINIDNADFKWETSFIFSSNKNKIVELYGAKKDDVANRWFIGQPVNVVYAMVFDGIWQKDELAPADQRALEGTAKVKDLNGDGKIDIDHDMKVLGSPTPDWIGTFSTTFTYKNWDLTGVVFTKQGSYVFSPFHKEFTDFNSKVILDVPYYVRENPITPARSSNTYPQATFTGQYWGESAEAYGYPGFNKDVSFVRIQNITLGYNFSTNVLSKMGLSSMRVYANVLNPFTFTKYDGFDPEWAGAEMSGVDATNTAYVIYQLGVNLKF